MRAVLTGHVAQQIEQERRLAVTCEPRHHHELTEVELENLVEQRTSELVETKNKLTAKVAELEKLNELMVGRELKMVELKEAVQKLQEEMNHSKRSNTHNNK